MAEHDLLLQGGGVMAEYIEREAALNWMYELIEARQAWTSDARGEIQGLNAAVCAIEDIPAADVEPVVHGKWENNHCSVCGMIPMGEEIWDSCEFCPPRFVFFMNYCPNCGARMDGDGDG